MKECNVIQEDGTKCRKKSRTHQMCVKHYTRWKRTGSPLTVRKIARSDETACTYVDPATGERCNADKYPLSRGLCPKHYYRWRTHGDPSIVTPRPRGEQHPSWGGDDVGWAAVHARLKREFGKASEYPCVDCGKPESYDWSYDGKDPNERCDSRNGMYYSTDHSHYAPRCRKCHRKLDARQGTEGNGGKLSRMDAERIRAAVAGGERQKDVAKRFNTTQQNVSMIVRRKTHTGNVMRVLRKDGWRPWRNN